MNGTDEIDGSGFGKNPGMSHCKAKKWPGDFVLITDTPGCRQNAPRVGQPHGEIKGRHRGGFSSQKSPTTRDIQDGEYLRHQAKIPV